MDFVYNDGTSAHRGVWHATNNLSIVVHPAEVETKTYEVRDYYNGVPFSQKVEGVNYTKPYGDLNVCGLCRRPKEGHPVNLSPYGHTFEEARVYPILGTTTLIVSTPEYTEGTGKARCGSGKFGGKNIDKPNLYRIGTSKKYAGKTLKIVGGKVVDKFYRTGTTPPQPFCGNCLKAITGDYGDSSVIAAETLGIIEVVE